MNLKEAVVLWCCLLLHDILLITEEHHEVRPLWEEQEHGDTVHHRIPGEQGYWSDAKTKDQLCEPNIQRTSYPHFHEGLEYTWTFSIFSPQDYRIENHVGLKDHHFFATALETCNTAWFDDGDVSTDGDSELLSDLRRKHWTKICSSPVDMEARTVAGIKSQHTKNTFHTYGASEGLLCLHSEQKWRQCDDYKVMFTCTGQFCSECRTRWFDHDDPEGNGDYELLSDLLEMYPTEICHQPIAIEVQTISGEPASNTSDTFLNYDATYGFACVNADQGSRTCDDYRVRFTCPKEFCQVSEQCRTQWLNGDNSTDEGDVESIHQLLKTFPGQVCTNPLSIEARTTSGISARHTGDTFLSYDVTFGFACINAKQRSKQCEDYQVILTCPSDFCQSCRTRWFDLDNPTKQGDYETLLQLQMLHPSEMCSQPVAIEAMTVSGVPAHRTGDVFQLYDASRGFACVNAEQPAGKRCQDYKVRFTCPLDFCSV